MPKVQEKNRLLELLNKAVDPPKEWFENVKGVKKDEERGITVEPLPCTSFHELVEAWKDTRDQPNGKKGALRWTDRYDIGLSTMLAVASSTMLPESQVWLRIIAVAGSGKSTLCEGVACNASHTFATSVFTGIHSGDSKDGVDKSLIPLINGRTFLINEGDTLLKQPNKEQLMSELRDLHFGISRCSYRNGKVETYDNIRTTVMIAGTPTLRGLNSSALGDRFLDISIYEKESKLAETRLVTNVSRMASQNIVNFKRNKELLNGHNKNYLSPEKIHAYRMTAGFLDYLRDGMDSGEFTHGIEIPNWYDAECERLGKIVALMRTRSGKGDEDHTEPELHTRLTTQLNKLGICQAVVLGTPIDKEVMRRIATVAYDTCYGKPFHILNLLSEEPMEVPMLANRLCCGQETVRKYLSLLRSIGCVQSDQSIAISGALRRTATQYKLTNEAGGLLLKLNNWMSGV